MKRTKPLFTAIVLTMFIATVIPAVAKAPEVQRPEQVDSESFIPAEMSSKLKFVRSLNLLPECLPVSAWNQIQVLPFLNEQSESIFSVGCRNPNPAPSLHSVDAKSGLVVDAADPNKQYPPPSKQAAEGDLFKYGWRVSATSDRRFIAHVATHSAVAKFAVTDAKTDRVIWRRTYDGPTPVPYDEEFQSLRYTDKGLVAFVRRKSNCDDSMACKTHTLIRIEIPRGKEAKLALPDDTFGDLIPYGTTEGLFKLAGEDRREYISENARGVIVDLDSMKAVWAGQRFKAPAPTKGIYCDTPLNAEEVKLPFDPMASDALGRRRDIFIAAKGASARLELKKQGAACAVSIDGQSVLIAIPPTVTLYRLK